MIKFIVINQPSFHSHVQIFNRLFRVNWLGHGCMVRDFVLNAMHPRVSNAWRTARTKSSQDLESFRRFNVFYASKKLHYGREKRFIALIKIKDIC